MATTSATKLDRKSLFGTDGIRGQANCYPITPEVALQLGKAMARVFQTRVEGKKRVLIGKDTRLSGYMLETALTSGLVSMGMDVFLVGPLPTPSVAHLTRSMNATAGIMLTASHNPFDDNGVKIFDSDGFKLSDEIEEEIEEQVLSGDLASDHIRSRQIGKAYRIEDARGRYIEFAKATIGNRSLEGLKVILDCANGAAYQIGPWIFRELGVEVIKAAVEPDGLNINEKCGALYPESVGALVKKLDADVGIAFDGDADRVVFCDEEGDFVDGDRIMAMCALDLKSRGRLARDTLVVTVMSNLGLHDALGQEGIRVVTTDVGDRHVIEKMRQDGYNFGGENSGHLVFMDHATTGDGIISALQVLKLMKTQGKRLSELSRCMEAYPHEIVSMEVSRKIPLSETIQIRSAIESCESDLGDEGRVLVRYSGTEPKIRILVEAREAPVVDKWCAEICSAVREELGS